MKEKENVSERRVTKRKLKFEGYKNRLEVTQLENKISHLEKTFF